MIFVTNVSSERWCTRGEGDYCLFVDLSKEDLVNDFNSTFDAKTLGFDWSEIPDFPSEIKTSSRFKNVEKIDLGYLSIVNIRKIKFNFIDSLDTLELGYNSIEVLHDNVFEFVPTITSLYLQRNKITTIQKDAFNGLTNLETLLLFYNQLKQIDSKIFVPILQLGEINLTGNRISDIGDVEFPPDLHYIDVSYNDIEKGLSNLLTLKNLTTVNVNQICSKSANVNCCTERKVIVESFIDRTVFVKDDFFDDCPVAISADRVVARKWPDEPQPPIGILEPPLNES